MSLRTYLIFPIIIFLSLSPFAYAEDVLWNASEQVHLCNVPKSSLPECGTAWQESGNAAQCNTAPYNVSRSCATRLHDPNITIKYHVQVTDDAGTNITCGSTVPPGTTLRLSFVPHSYEDVYWFGMGQSYDSPYGDWIANAASPSIAFLDKDYGGATCAGPGNCSTIYTYFPLSVNPPVKSISGIDAFGCGPADANGPRTCTPQQGGSFTPTFNFSATYGHFYWRFVNRVIMWGVADVDPMVTFTPTSNLRAIRAISRWRH